METAWNSERFREQVSTALEKITRILHYDKSKNLRPIGEALDHGYLDKYAIVEILSRLAISSTMNSWHCLGLDDSQLKTLKGWSGSRYVSLRFNAVEHCSFLHETKRDVDSSTKHVMDGFGGRIVSKAVTTITEYFWNFGVEYELVAYRGTGSDTDDMISIWKRCRETTVMTTTNNAPQSELYVRDPIDLNISPFLQYLCLVESENNIVPHFSVNRTVSTCRTSRRNDDVSKLVSFLETLYHWCSEICSYFSNSLARIEKTLDSDPPAMSRSSRVFVPVVPLMHHFPRVNDSGVFEAPAVRGVESELQLRSHQFLPPGHLDDDEVSEFLEEERRSLSLELARLESSLPSALNASLLITSDEACLLMVLSHMQEVCQHYLDGVNYVEDLLRSQLISAIGKVVRPIDFNNYMRYHNRQIFLPKYQPKVFRYSVRRSLDHAPEGLVTLEDRPSDGSIAEPVSTFVHSSTSAVPMQFMVNAASTISFRGERF